MDGIKVFQEMPETRAIHTSNLRLFVFEIINNMAIYNDESRVMDHNSTIFLYVKTVLVQLTSCVRLFVTPWTAACQASLSLTISQSLPKFMSIVLVMPSSHLIFWCFLLLLPSIFPSIREFSSKSAVCIRWSKYWSFSFSISPSNEYLGLISLKIRRRQWHPTPVLLPGKSHGQRSLVGCSPWGRKESDTTERLHFHFTFMHWRRKWQPTPVFLPGKSHGRRSLVGCSPWGLEESDTTERLHFTSFSLSLKIDWFGLLAVQGTLRSLLQHHSSKASILRHSTFFMVQLYWEPWIKVMLGKELRQLQKYLVATLLILEILLLPVSLYFFQVLNIVNKGFK